MSSYANYRTSPESQRTWQNPPTIVPLPVNQRNLPLQNRSPPSGSNPFGQSFKKGPRTFGNPTSTRTLTNANVKLEGPPRKRPKTDPTFTTLPAKQPVRSSRSGNEATDLNDEDEIVHVSGPEIVPNSDELDCLPSYEAPQSPSNLTQRSHPSKYPFSATKTPPGNEGSSSGLVPDGINTQWVDKNFGIAADKRHNSSDPIENDDYRRSYETRRSVKDLAQEFENNANPRKLDLARELNPQSKGKAKQMKSKFTPKDSHPSRSAIPMKRKVDDYIATRTTLRGPAEIGPISVKQLFIDQFLHRQSDKLQAFSSNGRHLYIMANGEEIFDLNSWMQDFEMIQYATGNTPAMQLRSQSKGSLTLVTIQFCQSNTREAGQYNTLLAKLLKLFKSKGVARTEQILQVAKSHLAAGDAESELKGSSTRRIQPVPKSTKPLVQYHKDLRYTPSPEDDIGSNLGSVRQISQTRSGGPSQAGAPRRSTRNVLPDKKSVDQDKVILVYPQGIPGAVNVTNSDLARLKPGEFLNDTLIEFGLKLWLRGLEATQPELASQVHIFNSFFYKKLNNKKSDSAAFETVRKWTAKFDLFQKKYIIVPINEHMHWYLAIIYEPEHVLSSTAEDPSPRKRTRLSAKIDENQDKSFTAVASASTESANGPTVDGTTISTPSSEAEVERNLDAEFQSSCNIDTSFELKEDKAEEDAHSDLSYVSEPIKAGPSTEHRFWGGSEGASRGVSELVSDDMDIDDSPDIEELDDESVANSTPSAIVKPNLQDLLTPGSRSAARIYQSAKSIGKQKAKPIPVSGNIDDVVERPDVVDIVGAVQSTSTRKTYIFTFDSLGTNHPHAIKKLGQYLRMEAKDKKNIPNAGLAGGKTALVPVQPNFCDCGVYLLHFAQTFVTDPDRYCRLILSQSRTVSNEERQRLWNDKKVADMRDELSARIQSLSLEWQKERALKEKEAQLQAASGTNTVDSDSDIEMPTPEKKSGRAVRMRG